MSTAEPSSCRQKPTAFRKQLAASAACAPGWAGLCKCSQHNAVTQASVLGAELVLSLLSEGLMWLLTGFGLHPALQAYLQSQAVPRGANKGLNCASSQSTESALLF